MARRIVRRAPPSPRQVIPSSARVATFHPGEPVPDAEYVRLVVPPGTPDDLADFAELQAKAKAKAVKVVREPAPRVAVPGSTPQQGFDNRPLREVVLARAERVEGPVGDREQLRSALEQLLTDAGL